MDRNKAALGAIFLLAAILVSPVVAAASVNPGSSTSIMGFPVTQSFTGLTVSTDYKIVCTSDGNSSVSFTSDSDGKATITQTPPDTGSNTYVLELDAGGAAVATWTIDNMDIMIYIIPLFSLMIVFGIIGAVAKMVKF